MQSQQNEALTKIVVHLLKQMSKDIDGIEQEIYEVREELRAKENNNTSKNDSSRDVFISSVIAAESTGFIWDMT